MQFVVESNKREGRRGMASGGELGAEKSAAVDLNLTNGRGAAL